MKLSEAIMLGSTTCKMVPGDWNSCALGCAGNAIGIGNKDRAEHRKWDITSAWPWLMCRIVGPETELRDNYCIGGHVVVTFDEKVCGGEMTLEQLVDMVRIMEPDCGDCNQFECTCPKAVEVAEAIEECLIIK